MTFHRWSQMLAKRNWKENMIAELGLSSITLVVFKFPCDLPVPDKDNSKNLL